MKRLTAATGAGVTVLALSLALVGCGSDDKASSSSSSDSASSTASSSAAAPTTSAPAAGAQKTISDYIAENKITEISMKRGDPGPNINVPLPDGWGAKQGALPAGTYGAIVDTRSAVPNNPPRILAVLSQLTGNVDPAEVLKYAPGELNNLPGFTGNPKGDPVKVSGYDAVQLGGNFADGDKKGTVSQKTVVIPVGDAVYVLQLNGFADESEAPALNDAMNIIGAQTVITP